MMTIISLVSEFNLTMAHITRHVPGDDITRGCQERLSRRDWYEAPARPAPAPLPRQEEVGIPRQPVVDWWPARPHPQVRLAQMQDFQGDGSVTLDMFSDQVILLYPRYPGFITGMSMRPVVKLELI